VLLPTITLYQHKKLLAMSPRKKHISHVYAALRGNAFSLLPTHIINLFIVDSQNRLLMLKKRVNLCVCLLAGLLILVGQISAQDKKFEVKGKVVSADNQPLEGVSITVKGTKTGGTVTDKNGQYRILVADGKVTLSFSYVGYGTKDEPVNGKNTLDVSLKQEAKDADEVVVIGYQTVRRKDLAAAVSSIGQKDLKDMPTNNAAEAISGRLAGVNVTVSEGAPGADVDVFVRGRGSITQNGAPLYIVDGVQIENALSILNPQDIQSIDVLKDAASTAIYGARGSNGVFLITTKGGKNTGGKTSVNYNAFFGTSTLANQLDMMDPYNFVLWNYERAKYTENPTDTGVAAQYIKRMSNYDTIAKTYTNYANPQNWQKTMMGRNAFQMTHNIGVSGGTAATQYNLSLSFNKQEGLLINSDYERKQITFRFDHKVSEKFKVGFNVRYGQQVVGGAGTSDVGGAGSNRLRQYVRYKPLILPGQTEDYYDPTLDANNPGNGLNMLNPIQLANAEYRLREIITSNYSGYANYNFTKLFSFKTTVGYNVGTNLSKGYDDTLTGNSRNNGRLPVLTMNTVNSVTLNNSNVFTYSNPGLKGSKHALDVLLGQEIYQTENKTNSMEVRYFPVGTKPDLAFANLGLATPPPGLAQPKPASAAVNTTQLSFFGRVNYSFDKKYLLTVNFRADGSSLFGPDYSSPITPSDPENRKWGYFPSASAAWRISQEKFMENVDFINDAKIRLSYGTAGNNRVAAYGYTTGYAPPSNAGYGLNDVLNYTLTLPSRLGNPVLQWESLTSQNLGFDLSFLRNRVTLTVDIYSNTTKNLLIENKIPPTSGYTTQYQNVGSTRNNGIEIQLGATVMKTQDFSWNANFNISFNKNKIVSLGSQNQFTANSGWFSSTANPDDYMLRVGEEVGTIYGLKTDGFYTVNDFTVTPYVNTANNLRYPTLLSQYTLKAGVANAAAVLSTGLASPGQIKFVDVNGDGKISLDLDRTIIGHALPKYTGGFNQTFSYKSFDASVFFNFSYGNDVYNANKLEFASAYGVDQNLLAIDNDRWKYIDNAGNLVQKQIDATTAIGIAPDQLAAVNANAKIWTPSLSTNGFIPSSYAIEDGSYLRVGNITVGYTLPQTLTRKIGISAFRVYATGNNLGTITGYSGYDPDVNARRSTPLTPGVDYGAYPRGRTYVFGLNVTF
jgi:TonB-linked SusC/RagA family outer membrane protein